VVGRLPGGVVCGIYVAAGETGEGG